jgi:hypothetical protein
VAAVAVAGAVAAGTETAVIAVVIGATVVGKRAYALGKLH